MNLDFVYHSIKANILPLNLPSCFQVAKFKDPRDACAAIVAESYRLWLQYETRTDDITVIIVHINGLNEVCCFFFSPASSHLYSFLEYSFLFCLLLVTNLVFFLISPLSLIQQVIAMLYEPLSLKS